MDISDSLVGKDVIVQFMPGHQWLAISSEGGKPAVVVRKLPDGKEVMASAPVLMAKLVAKGKGALEFEYEDPSRNRTMRVLISTNVIFQIGYLAEKSLISTVTL